LPFEEVAKLCGSDEELCFVLERVLIATPPLLRIDEDIKTAVEKAEKAEKFEDKTSARVAYKEAGDLSVYKGDLDEARRYYQKCLEIDPEWTGRRVLEYFLGGDGEKAMRVIDRYYSKFRIFQKKEEAEGK
jgi:tetratricopeptide (TPR) repeat protein